MILVSLAMAQAISGNCSSIDVALIVIIGIATKKEKVKESKWLEEFSSFDILISDLEYELVLKLALTTK